jgi:hypothetical protein
MEVEMLAAQVELNSGVDLVLVRIREAVARADPGPGPAPVERTRIAAAAQEPAEVSAWPAFVWGTEHSLFAVTLAAFACLQILALLA